MFEKKTIKGRDKKKGSEQREPFRCRPQRESRGERRHRRERHWLRVASRDRTSHISCRFHRLGIGYQLPSFFNFPKGNGTMKEKREEK